MVPIFSNQKSQFGGFWNGRSLYILLPIWSILQPIGTFCGLLVYSMVSLNIFLVLVCCTKKKLATLLAEQQISGRLSNSPVFLG
jgi:hypothetical protein